MRYLLTLGGLLVCSFFCQAQQSGSVNPGATAKTSAASTLISLQSLYQGGSEDGFAKDQATYLVDGSNVSALYHGGNGDGFDKDQSTFTIVGDHITSMFQGGIGDGFDKEQIAYTVAGENITSLFQGGNGDGFDKKQSTYTIAGDNIANMFQGGNGDGFDKEDEIFAIPSMPQIVQPSNGDLFCQNDTLSIEWNGFSPGASLEIGLTTDGGLSSIPLLNGVMNAQSPLSYPLANQFGDGTYQVMITNTLASNQHALSDPFEILANDTTYINTVTCDVQMVGTTQIDTFTNSLGCDSLVIQQNIFDNVPPVAICKPGLVKSLNRLGRYKPRVDQVDNGSFDNCGIASMTVSPAVFLCEDLGMQQITLIVTDVNGLVDSCTMPIEIVDQVTPKLRCPLPITVTADPLTCDAVVSHGAIQFVDNCSGAVLTQTSGLGNGDAYPIGVTTNEYEIVDAQGLSSTCSFTVTVLDPGNCAPAFLAGRKALETSGSERAGDAIAAFPNPFKGSTTIAVDITSAKEIQMDILDAQGQRVHALYEGWLQPGLHNFLWETNYGFAPGVYLVRLQSAEGVLTQRLVLIR
ncbi:MAG: HYR domain-containing protein [Bacteroidota bacterium]